jgi:membrane-associated phospholipid phosphatase
MAGFFGLKAIKLILLSLLVFSMSSYSQNYDIRLLKAVNLNRNTQLDNSFRTISYSVTPLSVATPVFLFGMSLFKQDSVMRRQSIYIGASLITAATISTILKYSVNRTRPFVKYPDLEKETHGGSPSFPSGHTSDAFSLATSLSLSYPKWVFITQAMFWQVQL